MIIALVWVAALAAFPARAGTSLTSRLTYLGTPELEGFTPDAGHLYVETGKALDLSDANGTLDVYDYVGPGFRRVSVGNSGTARFVAATPDGHYTYFSTATPIDPDDGDVSTDIYEEHLGQIRLATPHTPDTVFSFDGVSPDAEKIYFTTHTALTSDDNDIRDDLYSIDREGVLTLVSPGEAPGVFVGVSADSSRMFFSQSEPLTRDAPELGGIYELGPDGLKFRIQGILKAMSSDGTTIVVESSSSLVPEDVNDDIDVYENASGVTTLLSPGAAHGATFEDASSDLSRVFLAAGDQLTREDQDAGQDIYLSEHGGLTLLTPGDDNDRARFGGITPDGEHLYFLTDSALDSVDSNGTTDVYEWQASDPAHPTLISAGADGSNFTAVSDDNKHVYFETRSTVTATDTDNSLDFYAYDRDAPDGEGTIRLVTGGDGAYDPLFVAISSDGTRLVFRTKEQLSPDDTDGVYDPYVVDIDDSPPETTIGAAPSAVTAQTTAAIEFSGSPDAVYFTCTLDDGAAVGCESPWKLNGLATGEHVVTITAYDAFNNGDQSPASVSWFVDTDNPSGTIAVEAGRQYTTSRTVNLDVSGSDASSAVTQIALSNDGSNWTTRPYAPTQSWTLTSGDGAKTVYAKWKDAAGNWSDVARDTIVLDTDAPTGSVSIDGGASATKSAAVSLSVAASDAGAGVTQVALSNDGSSWTTRAYGATQSWTLTSGDGTKTVYAKWKDGAGHWSAVKTDTIVLDTSAPTATRPKDAFATGGTVNSGKVPVRLTWSGADTGSGIDHYELAQQTDDGSWTTVSASLPSASTTRSLAPGHSYRLRVRAVDRAGNVGAWAYGSTVRLTKRQESSGAIHYHGRWTPATAPAYWADHVRLTRTHGATASLTFTGRSFAWIAPVGPTRGRAKVFVDGSLVAKVDLHAATSSSRRLVFATTWSSAKSRTITIKCVGTAGHPRIDIDALVTGS